MVRELLVTPLLDSFKNGEFSKFVRTVNDLSNEHDLEAMELTKHSEHLNNEYENYKKAYKKNRGSILTPELAMLDRHRDNGLKLFQRSAKLVADFAYEEEDRNAGKLIYQMITKHGTDIYDMGYHQQGGVTDEIIDEVDEGDPAIGEAIDRLHLRKWYLEMKTAHKAFDKVFKARLKEQEQVQSVPNLPEIRKRTTAALRELFIWIFINAKKSGNMELFETYIGQLNILTTQYNTAVERRLGGNTDEGQELDDDFDPDQGA